MGEYISEATIKDVAEMIKTHFDSRWGQGAPVSAEEASNLSRQLLEFLQKRSRQKAA